jgi:hypothetical protein
MPKKQHQIPTVSEIRVEPVPPGIRWVYLIETRSMDEADEIAKLFLELESKVQVCPLCVGKLVGYAVQAHHSDVLLLDELEDVLRRTYAFVITYRSFEPLIYRIVDELCKDTQSTLLPLPQCNICGNLDPFPNTVVSLADVNGSVLISRSYCSSCTAQIAARSHKEFIKSLLVADECDFGCFEEADLVRRPSGKRSIRFKVGEFKTTDDKHHT